MLTSASPDSSNFTIYMTLSNFQFLKLYKKVNRKQIILVYKAISSNQKNHKIMNYSMLIIFLYYLICRIKLI